MLALDGCAGTTTVLSTPAAPLAAPSPAASPGASVTGSEPAVQAALVDAASHLGVAPESLQVESVESVDWPDSSLGCPQPGMLYSQVVTPGYLVVVSGAGKRLEYHADRRGRAVLCRQS